MFSKAYLVVCAFTAIAMAQIPAPTCYPAGASPASDCDQFVDNFCTFASLATTRINDSVGRCYNLPNNRVCDFIAWNTFIREVPPSAANCRDVLHNVINKCAQNSGGGYGQPRPNTYTFTVDINRGQCNHDVHCGS